MHQILLVRRRLDKRITDSPPHTIRCRSSKCTRSPYQPLLAKASPRILRPRPASPAGAVSDADAASALPSACGAGPGSGSVPLAAEISGRARQSRLGCLCGQGEGAHQLVWLLNSRERDSMPCLGGGEAEGDASSIVGRRCFMLLDSDMLPMSGQIPPPTPEDDDFPVSPNKPPSAVVATKSCLALLKESPSLLFTEFALRGAPRPGSGPRTGLVMVTSGLFSPRGGGSEGDGDGDVL